MSIQSTTAFYLNPIAKRRIGAAVYQMARNLPVEPDKAVLVNRTGDKVYWECTINLGYHVAVNAVNLSIQRNSAHFGGPALASYLPNLLLSSSVTAALMEGYIDTIAIGAGLESPVGANTAARAQFFFYYLGVLFERDRDRGRIVALRIFFPLVRIAILMNDKVNRDPANRLGEEAQQHHIRTYHDDLLKACQSEPQTRLVAPPPEPLFVFLDTVGREPATTLPETEPVDSDALDTSVAAGPPAFATLISSASSLAAIAELAAIDAAEDLDTDELDLVVSLLTAPPFSDADHGSIAPSEGVDTHTRNTIFTSTSASSASIDAVHAAAGSSEGNDLEEHDVAAAVFASSSLSLTSQTPWASPAMKRKACGGNSEDVEEVLHKRAREAANGQVS